MNILKHWGQHRCPRHDFYLSVAYCEGDLYRMDYMCRNCKKVITVREPYYVEDDPAVDIINTGPL